MHLLSLKFYYVCLHFLCSLNLFFDTKLFMHFLQFHVCVLYVVFLLYWGYICCCLRCCCLCYYSGVKFVCCWGIFIAFTPPCTPDICAKLFMHFFAFSCVFSMLYFCCIEVSIVVVWGAVVYVIIVVQYLDVVGAFVLHLLHPVRQISAPND